jgi:hypothetical protein
LAFEIPESESDKKCADTSGGLFYQIVTIVVEMVVGAALMPLF